MFQLIVISILLFDAVFWWWADRRLRVLRWGIGWRLALAAFMAVQLGQFAWMFASRWTGIHLVLPPSFLALLYVWHLMVLPIFIVLLTAGGIAGGVAGLARRILRARRTALQPIPVPVPASRQGPTRRQVLLAGVAAVPPLFTGGTVAMAMGRLDHFRVRPIELALPDLPPALDGLRIAHIADVHTGRFTSPLLLESIVERTNELDVDLVLMTGDLIDYSLVELPRALDMVRQLRAGGGLFMCEGNHDLFDNRLEFERQVLDSGVPLLLDDQRTLSIRGQAVQVLGIRWGGLGDRHDAQIPLHVRKTLELRDPDAFQILLAHHPHAFDLAADAGVPLTLAGHTHGGQVMLTPDLGPGPLLYKYWSGPYRRGNSALVVSNGVGNWFPVRVNAPAEIIHITLRCSAPAERLGRMTG